MYGASLSIVAKRIVNKLTAKVPITNPLPKPKKVQIV